MDKSPIEFGRLLKETECFSTQPDLDTIITNMTEKFKEEGLLQGEQKLHINTPVPKMTLDALTELEKPVKTVAERTLSSNTGDNTVPGLGATAGDLMATAGNLREVAGSLKATATRVVE